MKVTRQTYGKATPEALVESALWETRAALKDTKRKNREQARKARQLVTAVAAKIEEKDEEMERVRYAVRT